MRMTQSARDWHNSPFGARPPARVGRFFAALLLALALHLLVAIGLWLMPIASNVTDPPTPIILATLQHHQPKQRLTEPATERSLLDDIVITTSDSPTPQASTPQVSAPQASTPQASTPQASPPVKTERARDVADTEVLNTQPYALRTVEQRYEQREFNERHTTDAQTTAETTLAEQAQPTTLSDWQADDTLSQDPLERQYQQIVLAHLRQHLIVPAHLHGEVRIRFTLRYRHIATDVHILEQQGDPALALWITRRVLQANPFPAVPPELPDPWSFSPTLIVQSP